MNGALQYGEIIRSAVGLQSSQSDMTECPLASVQDARTNPQHGEPEGGILLSA